MRSALPTRSELELRIPRVIREEILLCEWHVPRPALAAAVRSVIRTKSQRGQTIQCNQASWGKADCKFQQSLRSLVLGLRRPPMTTLENSTRTVRAYALLRQHECAVRQQVAFREDNKDVNHDALELNPMRDEFDYAQYHDTQPSNIRTRETTAQMDSAPSSRLHQSEQHRPEQDTSAPRMPNDAYLARFSDTLWASAATSRRARSCNAREPTTLPTATSSGSSSPHYCYYRPKENTFLAPPTRAAVPREIYVRHHGEEAGDYHDLVDDHYSDGISVITNDTALYSSFTDTNNMNYPPVPCSVQYQVFPAPIRA
jgi:hypothetical protein